MIKISTYFKKNTFLIISTIITLAISSVLYSPPSVFILPHTIIGKLVSANQSGNSVNLFFPEYETEVSIIFDAFAIERLKRNELNLKIGESIWVDVEKRDKNKLQNSYKEKHVFSGYSLITSSHDILSFEDYISIASLESVNNYNNRFYEIIVVILILIISIDLLLKNLDVIYNLFVRSEKWIEDNFVYSIDENSKEGKLVKKLKERFLNNEKYYLLKDFQAKSFHPDKDVYKFQGEFLKSLLLIFATLLFIIGIIYIAIDQNKPLLYVMLPTFVGEFIIIIFLTLDRSMKLELNKNGFKSKFKGDYRWEEIETMLVARERKHDLITVYFHTYQNKEIVEIPIGGLELKEKQIVKIINHFYEDSKKRLYSKV